MRSTTKSMVVALSMVALVGSAAPSGTQGGNVDEKDSLWPAIEYNGKWCIFFFPRGEKGGWGRSNYSVCDTGSLLLLSRLCDNGGVDAIKTVVT